jgi:hypothetical protein
MVPPARGTRLPDHKKAAGMLSAVHESMVPLGILDAPIGAESLVQAARPSYSRARRRLGELSE